MAHDPRRAGVRARFIALAMVLMLAAGQVAGCASDGTEDEAFGESSIFDTEILVAAGAILAVLAAGMETAQQEE